MRYVILSFALLPMFLIVAIAFGPLFPMLLLAVAAFAIVWLAANAVLGLGLWGLSTYERHRAR